MRSTSREPSDALGQVKGVVFLTRGMFRRNIQRGKIVEVFLDVRPLGDDKTHLAKDRDDLVNGLADRVDAAFDRERHRQGDVGTLESESLFKRRSAQALGRRAESGGDPVLGHVQFGAGAPPRLRVERAELAHGQGQTAAASEPLDADLFQSLRRSRRRDFGGRRFDHLVYVANPGIIIHFRLPRHANEKGPNNAAPHASTNFDGA